MNTLRTLAAALLLTAATVAQAGSALCPGAALPVQGGAVRGAAPLFPADNWWNHDIRSAPVDANSAAYIGFIGGTRTLHPDFGGEESPGSIAIYGFPYAVVGAGQVKLTVSFGYADESDGVGLPFYPVPVQAVTQPHWVEGGAAGNVDQRSAGDRHLLMVDCANNHLYELYNVWWDGTKWLAGSGAFFDMSTNQRRPEGWTSADAAGLAIFPGLVRYDEVYDNAVTELGHALRVTVRATNGHVWPASHRAGSTAGALPMGARLRLKSNVNGSDPALRSADPQMRKIFRAMQTHGLIVADNGSDLYVSGTFDTRWNNDILNPAFRLLKASDFEVVQLGWRPEAATAALSSLSLQAGSVTGGAATSGTVLLTAAAPAGGATVALASSHGAVAGVPASVAVAEGASSASFNISTSAVASATTVTLSASWLGVTRSATLTVQPAAAVSLQALALSSTRVAGGSSLGGSVRLSGPAPAGGVAVALRSSAAALARVPGQVLVPAGASSASFTITTTRPRRDTTVMLSARWAQRTVSAPLVVTRH